MKYYIPSSHPAIYEAYEIFKEIFPELKNYSKKELRERIDDFIVELYNRDFIKHNSLVKLKRI